jgi:hypothetical protein
MRVAAGTPMMGMLNLMELYDGRLHSGHINVGFQLHGAAGFVYFSD